MIFSRLIVIRLLTSLAGAALGVVGMSQLSPAQWFDRRAGKMDLQQEMMGGATERANGELEALLARDRKLVSEPIACLNQLSAEGAIQITDLSRLCQTLGGDPSQLFAIANSLESGVLRDAIIRFAFESVIKSDPASALDILGTIPVHLRRELGSKLACDWVSREGIPALSALFQSPMTTEKELYFAMKTMASKDRLSALKFFRDSPEETSRRIGYSKEFLLNSILQEVDPQVGLEFLKSFPRGVVRDKNMARFIGNLIGKEPQKAEQYLKDLKGDVAIVTALGYAATTAVEKDPESARYLLELIPGERERGRIAQLVVQSLFASKKQTPERVHNWILAIQDPVTRAEALKEAQNLERDAAKRNSK